MKLFFSVFYATLATLIATFIINIFFYFFGLISIFYRFFNFFKSNQKIVFVFEKHQHMELRWRNYWKIFKQDGYKIIRIKNQNNKNSWKKIKKYLKKANDVSIAGYAKIEYAFFIGIMSSKKETTVFYLTQNSQIKKMVFKNDRFNIKKLSENSFKEKELIILQNKKSFKNTKSKEIIDISTENEHPESLEYIFEIRKIANEIATKNKEIKIQFIGKTIFAFAFAQIFSYDAYNIIVEDCKEKCRIVNLKNIINDKY